jgi:hypothetical protein
MAHIVTFTIHKNAMTSIWQALLLVEDGDHVNVVALIDCVASNDGIPSCKLKPGKFHLPSRFVLVSESDLILLPAHWSPVGRP